MATGIAPKIASAALMAAAAACCLGAGEAAARAAAAEIVVPPLKFSERRLANGLRVVSLRDATTPNVYVSMWYGVGSKHDPEGRSGFAHLFEHILSRKTRNMTLGMINTLVEDVGGLRNASTATDRTRYYDIVPARYLEMALWTHAERMTRPVIDPEVFEAERQVVKEEIRQNVYTPPYGRLRLLITDNAWDGLPHRRPSIGDPEELDAARMEEAWAFHEAFYGPDTGTLIVSGNFDQRQLDTWVDHYFGSVGPRPNKISLVIPKRDPAPAKRRTATMYVPNMPAPVVGSIWKTPGYSHSDTPALTLLDLILTEGDSSRLNRSLVRDKQIAVQVRTANNQLQGDQGFYAPILFVAKDKSVTEAEAALAAEIANLRETRVSAAELTEAKNKFLARTLRQRETFSERAEGLGEALVRSGDANAWDKSVAAVLRVTPADIRRVARKYLAAHARVDVRYLDERERPQGIGQHDWKNPASMPRFKPLPRATHPPVEIADETVREKPPAPGPALAVPLPIITESRLPTGLSVVTAQSSDMPLATMTLVLKAGAGTYPPAQAGLAGLAARVASKGTRTRTGEQIAAEFESLGATLASEAGPDGATLTVTAPTRNLEAAGHVLADIVQNATFPAAEFEIERKRALSGLALSLNSPGPIASMVAQSLLYGDSPYGTLVSGTPSTLAALTRDDLANYRDQWWAPSHAALIMTGGIDADGAFQLARRLFGSWRGEASLPTPPLHRAGSERAPKTVVIDMPGAGQAAVLAAVRSLSRRDPDFYALSVVNAVLGTGATSRLYREIRTKRSLSYFASSSNPQRSDAGMLSATAQTKNETAAEVAQVILDEFDRIGREPLPASDVERRIAYLTGSLPRQMETSQGLADMLAALLQSGLPPSEANRLIQRIEAVTPSAASAVASRLIRADHASLVIVGDASKFLDKVKTVRPDVEVIPLRELDLNSSTLRKEADPSADAWPHHDSR